MSEPYPKPTPRPRKRLAHGSTLAAPTKPMRKHSLTNAGAVAWREQYLPKRDVYLEAHPWCEMTIAGVCPHGRHEATEVQHMVQRGLDPSIENLLDETHWKASCHDANAWCGTHPQQAIALGLEIRTNRIKE